MATYTFTYHPSNTVINACDVTTNWTENDVSQINVDDRTFLKGAASLKLTCSYFGDEIEYDNSGGTKDWRSGATPETGGFGFWCRGSTKGLLLGIEFERTAVWDGGPAFYVTLNKANTWEYKHFELYDAPTYDWSDVTGIRFVVVRNPMDPTYSIASEENLNTFAGAVVDNYYIHNAADVGAFKTNHVYKCTVVGGPPSTYTETVPTLYHTAEILDDDFYRRLMSNPVDSGNYHWQATPMFTVNIDDIQIYTANGDQVIDDTDVNYIEKVEGEFFGSVEEFQNFILYKDGNIKIVETGVQVPDPNTDVTITYSSFDRSDLFEKLMERVTLPLDTDDPPLREFMRTVSSQLVQHQVNEYLDFIIDNYIHLAGSDGLDYIGGLMKIPRFNYTDFPVYNEYYYDKSGDKSRALYIISTDATDVGLTFSVEGIPADVGYDGVIVAAGTHDYPHAQWKGNNANYEGNDGVPVGISMVRLDEVPTGYVLVFDAHPGEGDASDDLGEFCQDVGDEDANYRVMAIFPPEEVDEDYRKRLLASVKYLRTNGNKKAIQDLVSELAVNLDPSDVLLDFGYNYGAYWGDGTNAFVYADDADNFFFDDYGYDGFKYLGFVNDNTSTQIAYWSSAFDGTQPAFIYIAIPDNSRFFNDLRAVFATHLIAKTLGVVFTGGIRLSVYTYSQMVYLTGE